MKQTIFSLMTTLALAASNYAADIAGKSLVLKIRYRQRSGSKGRL